MSENGTENNTPEIGLVQRIVNLINAFQTASGAAPSTASSSFTFTKPKDVSQFDLLALTAQLALDKNKKAYRNALLRDPFRDRVNSLFPSYRDPAFTTINKGLEYAPELTLSALGHHGADKAISRIILNADNIAANLGQATGRILNPSQMGANVRQAARLARLGFSNNFNAQGVVNTDFTHGLDLEQSADVYNRIIADPSHRQAWASKRISEMRQNGGVSADGLSEADIKAFATGLSTSSKALTAFNKDYLRNFQAETNKFVAAVTKMTGNFEDATSFIQRVTGGAAFTAGSKAEGARKYALQVADDIRMRAIDSGIAPSELYSAMKDIRSGISMANYTQAQGANERTLALGYNAPGAAGIARANAAFLANWTKTAGRFATPEQRAQMQYALQSRAEGYASGDADDYMIPLALAVQQGAISEEEAEKLASGDIRALQARLYKVMSRDKVEEYRGNQSVAKLIKDQTYLEKLNGISYENSMPYERATLAYQKADTLTDFAISTFAQNRWSGDSKEAVASREAFEKDIAKIKKDAATDNELIKSVLKASGITDEAEQQRIIKLTKKASSADDVRRILAKEQADVLYYNEALSRKTTQDISSKMQGELEGIEGPELLEYLKTQIHNVDIVADETFGSEEYKQEARDQAQDLALRKHRDGRLAATVAKADKLVAAPGSTKSKLEGLGEVEKELGGLYSTGAYSLASSHPLTTKYLEQITGKAITDQSKQLQALKIAKEAWVKAKDSGLTDAQATDEIYAALSNEGLEVAIPTDREAARKEAAQNAITETVEHTRQLKLTQHLLNHKKSIFGEAALPKWAGSEAGILTALRDSRRALEKNPELKGVPITDEAIIAHALGINVETLNKITASDPIVAESIAEALRVTGEAFRSEGVAVAPLDSEPVEQIKQQADTIYKKIIQSFLGGSVTGHATANVNQAATSEAIARTYTPFVNDTGTGVGDQQIMRKVDINQAREENRAFGAKNPINEADAATRKAILLDHYGWDSNAEDAVVAAYEGFVKEAANSSLLKNVKGKGDVHPYDQGGDKLTTSEGEVTLTLQKLLLQSNVQAAIKAYGEADTPEAKEEAEQQFYDALNDWGSNAGTYLEHQMAAFRANNNVSGKVQEHISAIDMASMIAHGTLNAGAERFAEIKNPDDFNVNLTRPRVADNMTRSLTDSVFTQHGSGAFSEPERSLLENIETAIRELTTTLRGTSNRNQDSITV